MFIYLNERAITLEGLISVWRDYRHIRFEYINKRIDLLFETTGIAIETMQDVIKQLKDKENT